MALAFKSKGSSIITHKHLRQDATSNSRVAPAVSGTLHLVLVSKGENAAALRGTTAHITTAARLAMRAFRATCMLPHITVLLDEGSRGIGRPFTGDQPSVCIVPKNFTCPQGGRAKARALQFFIERSVQSKSNRDWIMHLDEETHLCSETIQEALSFIKSSEETNYTIGQGLIVYNGNRRSYFKNPLIAVADIARVVDDLGKLFWQNAVVHTPAWGMRGSFLLIRADVELSIGWDTSSLVEDHWFSQQVRHPLTYHVLPIVCVSLRHVTDYIY